MFGQVRDREAARRKNAEHDEARRSFLPGQPIVLGQLQRKLSSPSFRFRGRPDLFVGLVEDRRWLERDGWGYVKVDDEMRTNLPGVFAAGDVASKKFRQITTAVADGTIASMALAKELAT